MDINYINNETRDFLGAQDNHMYCKKLKQLRKQHIAPLTSVKRFLKLVYSYTISYYFTCYADSITVF